MKRSFSVNMGGATFSFDEDALEMMERYIARVTDYYKGNGEELKVAEVEEKIAAKISARTAANGIVTIELVRAVLDEIGMPFGAADCESQATETTGNATSTATRSSSDNHSGQATSEGENEQWRAAMLLGRKLFRDPYDICLGGVLAGIAKYNGWSIAATRAIVAIIFILGGSIAFPSFLLLVAYIIMWIALPTPCSIVDVTRMHKPMPKGYAVEDMEAAWMANYEIAKNEIAFKKNNGCLSALVKVLFFTMLAIVGVPLLFALGIVLFVFVIILFVLVGVFGTALFSNIYVLLLLILPLFALIHWILKKSGVCRPLNVYVKLAIILGWLVTLLFACYSLHLKIEENGGWNKIHQELVDGKFNEDFWEELVEDVVLNNKTSQYTRWVDQNNNLPFVVDLKHKTPGDDVFIKFYNAALSVDSSNLAGNVAKMTVKLGKDENEGVMRYVWNSNTNEILVSMDNTLGCSMRINPLRTVSGEYNIRYMKDTDSIDYNNAVEKGCVPFEIRFSKKSLPQMYMFVNDSTGGVCIPPVSSEFNFSSNGVIEINGRKIGDI